MGRRIFSILCIVGLICSSVLWLNCSKNSVGGDDVDDGSAPDVITDLAVQNFTDSSITLTWTASGDDHNSGTATRYELRMSYLGINWINFDSATLVSNLPAPQIAGTTEHFEILNLENDSTYYFAMKVYDENDNCDGISNIVNATCINDFVVNFPDAGLLAAIRTRVGKPSGNILKSDLLSVTDLEAADRSISDLSGIEYCTKLRILNITNNAISDLAPLSAMVQLEQLHAGQNNIDDLAPLADLAELYWIRVNLNQITDIEPLSDLINLSELDLQGNLLTEISALSDLVQLTALNLASNFIKDISPLLENSGLDDGDIITLAFNPLRHESIMNHILTLRARGVTVNWVDNTQPPIAIADLEVDTVMETSVKLSWTAPGEDYYTGIAYKYALRYSTNTTDLTSWSGGTLLEDLPNPDTAGTGQSYVVTGLETGATYYFALRTQDNSENWSEVSNIVLAQPFTDVVVTFPDAALEEAIRQQMDKPGGDIYKSELALLDSLLADSRGISDLTGLEQCLNLQVINLSGNDITAVDQLSSMLLLRDLNLQDNNIADISPLGSLSNLQFLQLSLNPLSSLEDLSSLTGLTVLALSVVGVQDLQPLSALTNLQYLFIFGNSITDISPLVSCTHLIYLYADVNLIQDISILSELTELNNVSLKSNQVQDISALVNNAGLTEGDQVALDSNPLSQESLNTYIPALQARGVIVTY